jgi:hypothetical protein
MNTKRFVLAAVAVFVVLQVTDFLIHSVILSSNYESLANVWRPDMMSKMWIMTVVSLFMSFMIVFIFTKGYQGKGIGEGVRFGLIIGLLMMVVGNLSQYAIYPLPFSLAIQWIIYGVVQFVIAGVVMSLIYKPKTS